MSIFEVGRLCLKLAGRDAGNPCVVVEKIDDLFVLVDGATRRRKVNINHLEPLTETLDIKDKASHEDVKKAFENKGLSVLDTKKKSIAQRLRKQKKQSQKEAKVSSKKSEKKASSVKKETVPSEEVSSTEQ